uniref:AMP-dependent synthetase/ligase domain-containing protein n=1 Tax=viral metagenome TaxID=1070528 RepID=A0A6C0AQS8_9ZZZZ
MKLSTFYLILFFVISFILIIAYTARYILYDNIDKLYKINSNRININKREFILNVCKNIPYYNNYTADTLPIVTKQQISKNTDLFCNKNIPKIASSIKSANNSWTDKENVAKNISLIDSIYYTYEVLSGKAIAHVSGGSSGNYFYQWYTYDEYVKASYGFFKCWINMGWKPTDKVLIYYFHGANSVKLINKLNFLHSTFNSIIPELDENGDIKESTLYELVDCINNFKPELIVSFPSLIFRLSQLIYMKDIKLTHIPKCMDLSADFLFTCQYKFICSIFKNCDIRLSYGTIEFGQIAQQIPNRMFDYIVFDDIVDVENDQNNNLIITNYLYTTQPIIRYLTDDKGTVTHENKNVIIRNLIGKSNDSFNYIDIDNFINNCSYSIINLRIDNKNKIIALSTLYDYDIDNISFYFNGYFNNYTIQTDVCKLNTCKTKDRYDRKNTPIMNEFHMRQEKK